jgi:hypothetical protein
MAKMMAHRGLSILPGLLIAAVALPDDPAAPRYLAMLD